MYKIDKEFFFSNYKSKFGTLNQTQVDNLNILIDTYDSDDKIDRITQFAYILATIYHETATTFKPIAEYGKGKGKYYGVPDKETGKIYYGRGFIQLTHRFNYQKASDELGIDFVNEPDKVMEIDNATKICFIGMNQGWFTGKKLSDYFTDSKTDWINCRKIINGMDKANLIGNIGKNFYDCLQYDEETESEPIGIETS